MTSVSSIAAPLSIIDLLIVIISIGECAGDTDNLESVIKEYDNIIDTFLKYYKLNSKLHNNKDIYMNNINDIGSNHDRLMFFISSHGYRGKVLYDSECKKYKLVGMYSAEAKEESNHLLSIPNIFFLDMCRGKGEAKVTDWNTKNIKQKQQQRQQYG